MWQELKNRIDTIVQDVRDDPKFQQTFRDAERMWQEVEREVAMIREQMRENSRPIVDDTKSLKQKLDAYRKRSKR